MGMGIEWGSGRRHEPERGDYVLALVILVVLGIIGCAMWYWPAGVG